MSTATVLQFENYVEAQPYLEEAPVCQPERWFVQELPAKKPHRFVDRSVSLALGSGQAADVQMSNATPGLDHMYIMEDRSAVVRFVEEHRLHGLLLQASQPLTNSFGDTSVKTLSLFSDEEGFETLFCVVSTSGDLQCSREALRTFDRHWWLHHAKQAAGRLNFDFKLL